MDTRLGATHLKRLRRTSGLTQEQLAEASGVSVRTLRSLESGTGREPRRRTLEQIAVGLGLTDHETDDLVALSAHDWRDAMNITTYWPQFAIGEQRETMTPDVDDIVRTQLTKHRILTQSVQWLYGPQAQCERLTVSATLQALESGPARRYFLQQYDPGRVDLEQLSLLRTENCRLGATHMYRSAHAKGFELHLDRVLAKGEYYTLGYVADFSRAALPGVPSDPEYYMFSYAPGTLASIQVRFTPPAVPTWVRHVWRETGDAEPEHVADVPLNAFNTAQIVVESTRPGGVGLVWAWPDLG